MPTFTPVDDDPFAPTGSARLVPVDYDPFKEPPKQVAPASGVFPAVNDSGLASVPAALLSNTPSAHAPTPSTTPIAGSDPGILQEAYGDAVKGLHSAKRGAFLTGYMTNMYDDVDNIANHLAASRDLENQYPMSPAVAKAADELEKLKDSGAGGILPALGVYARNPRLAASTAVQSLPSMLSSLVTVPVGAAVGSLVGPEGTVIGGLAGVGVGSAAADFGNAFEDYARDKWKPQTAAEWKAILSDPAKYREAGNYAALHSGMVGLFDAVGGKLAGKAGMAAAGKLADFGATRAGRLAGGAIAGGAVESATGAGGEAAGQLAGSGRITDPGAVAGEAAAQVVTGAPAALIEPVVHATNLGGAKNTPVTPEDLTKAGEAIQGGGVAQGPTAEVFQPKPEDVSGSMIADAGNMFYSPLRKYIEEKGPGAATPEVWQNTIRNAPGVKAEEVADLGLPDYFNDNPGKITKKDLLDHIDTNAIRVEETQRDQFDAVAAGQRQQGINRQIAQIIKDNNIPVPVPDDHPLIADLVNEKKELRRRYENRPQYESYTLPGDRQGYTELTMHIPTRNIEGDAVQRDFVGGHYPEANVIAHVRVTDRVDANGTPMALIEEIQSDWHQAGRKKDYRPVDTQNTPVRGPDTTPVPTGWESVGGWEPEGGGPIVGDNRFNPLDDTRVPEGPFKTSWDELAFKRMLRWAADKGYTRLAWVNAAEQSRRYPGDARRDAGMRQFYDKTIPSIAKRWAKRLGGTWGTTQIAGPVDELAPYYVYDQQGNHVNTFWQEDVAKAFADENGFTYSLRPGKQQEVQYIDLPRAALDVVQKGLPMYSEINTNNSVQVSTSPTAADVGAMFGEALQNLVKALDIRVPVELVLNDGRTISYKTMKMVKGRPTLRTQRVNNALGMAIGYNTSRPQIHIALGHHGTAQEVWGTITHELGHIVMATTYARASAAVKIAMRTAYDEFRSKVGLTKNLKDIIKLRDNAVIALHNTRGFNDTSAISSPQQRQYWLGFEEWFAENVARWATSQDKPLSLIEKFFSGLGKKIKSIFQQAQKHFGVSFEPSKAMNDWLNSFHIDAEPFAEDINTVNTVKTTAENQQQMGPEEKAVEQQPETVAVREVVGQIFNGRPPKEVQETVAYADKFNKIYKWMLGIHQVAQRNAHIVPLQEYTETIAVAQLTKQQIMIRAQEVLKQWNKLGGKQGDAVAALLDDVANMVYLTPDEVKNKVARFPTNPELMALVDKHGVSQQGLATFREIATTFQEHLVRYEAVLRNEANKITDPQKRADRHDEITLQMKALSSRPYFPFMRFGDYTITVRNAAKQVIHFETFERRAKRDRAMAEIQKNMAPDDTIQAGKLDRQVRPLLGVPTQLLDMMAAKLTMSPAQREALEQLKFELSPAQSFKHRFQHKNRIAGYSQDFRRAYANYFFHGANHLMKAMYADRLRGLTKATKEETATALDATTRHEIVAYMNDHLENWLDPKSDWAAIRSVAFLWSLAFSPAAAAQNLTQTLMTTYPFLAQQFGDAKAIGALTRTGADFTTFYKKGTIQNATDFELRAVARGISDGIINETMAPELAGFAEGRTLGLGFGGNELQRGITKFNEWGAKLFELAEQVNRRLVFRATLKLAQENPGSKYVKDMRVKHRLHYDALRKEGWTEAEASAYVAARDATITTQFQYGREYAPRIMRGKLRSIFVFKTFIQSYVLFLANYPHAAVRSVLILGFLGGLMGVPGADDLKEILKALGWRLFGKDFDLEKEARKLILEMVGKDNNGADIADIALHGVARRGYGIPAFLDMLGGTVGVDVPMPTFDRSKAISAGTLLPIELGKLFGPPTQDVDTVISSQAQKASGAVFGAGFNIYKAITNTKLDWNDSKRWERAVPRALGSVAHAMRVGYEGKERSNTGSTIVKYDVRDTEQLMEVMGIAAGYTPFRTSLQWDRIMAGQEAVKLWDIRREGLMKQMGNAVLGKDQKEIDRVREAIKKFNADLPQEARGKAISADAMKQSIGGQARARAAQESGMSVRKSDIPILQEVQKLYPDAQVTGVRRVRGTP